MQEQNRFKNQPLCSTAVGHHVQQAHVLRAELVAQVFGMLAGAVRRWMKRILANRMARAEA